MRSTFPFSNISKRVILFGLLTFGMSIHTSWAGGVVEEFRVQPHALTKHGASDITQDNPKASHGTLPYIIEEGKNIAELDLVRLYYDPVRNWTTLRWRPAVQEGQHPLEYHIYRWKDEHCEERVLIAKVSGDVFEYTDRTRESNTLYGYKIIGIYKINGAYKKWQYPYIKPIHSSPKQGSLTPVMGLGCTTLHSSNPHSPFTLWLAFFTLLFFVTRKVKRQNP